MKRFTITLSDELCEKVDRFSVQYGCTRSSLVASWVGEKVASIELAKELFTDDFVEKIIKRVCNEMEVRQGANKD